MTPDEAREILRKTEARARDVLGSHAPNTYRWVRYDSHGAERPAAMQRRCLLEVLRLLVGAEAGAKRDAYQEVERLRAALTLADVPTGVPANARQYVLAGARTTADRCAAAIKATHDARAAEVALVREAMAVLGDQ